MKFLSKFYDIDVAGAGGETAVLDKPEVIVKEETPNVASLMAKQGIKTTNDSPAQKEPIVNKTENKEEAKADETEVKKVDTTTPSNEAKANSESQTQEKEKEEVALPQKEEVTKTQPSLQEVLRSQQPDFILKELGFDDKAVKLLHELKGFDRIDYFTNLVSEWKKNGNVNGYLKELSTDYTKMPSEEVMRHQLSVEYPKASQKQLDALYRKEIVETYNLNSDDSELAEEGKLLLDAKADKYRDKLIENQQNFLMPKAPEPKQPEPDLSRQIAQQKFEAYESTINKDPYSSKVFENKKIVIGKGDDKFTVPIDPSEIKGLLFDTEKWNSALWNIEKNFDGTVKSETPKVENQILVALFAQNPQKFLEDYAQHLLSRGGQKAIDPLDNAKKPDMVNMSNTQQKPSNAAEAMAKSGVKVTSGA